MMRFGILVTMLWGTFAAADESPQFFTLASGAVGANYFASARAICAAVNRTSEGAMRCSPEATPGSVYNLDALARNEVDFAIVQSDWLYAAYTGTGVFQGHAALTDLRGVMALYHEDITILVSAASGITDIAELKGADVNLGSPASGRRATAEKLFNILGVDPATFNSISEVPTDGAIDELCEGRLDAVVLVVGHPDASVARAVDACHANIITFDDPEQRTRIEAAGLYAPSIITADAYAGNYGQIQTYSVAATLVTRDKLGTEQDARVVALVTTLRENAQSLAMRVPVLEQLNTFTDWTKDFGIPEHKDVPM